MDLKDDGDHIISHCHEEEGRTKPDFHQQEVTHSGCGEHEDGKSRPQKLLDEDAPRGPPEVSDEDGTPNKKGISGESGVSEEDRASDDDRSLDDDRSSDENGLRSQPDPEEAAKEEALAVEIGYKIRDMLSRCFDAGILDVSLLPPLLVGPLKPQENCVFFNNDVHLEAIPRERKVDLMITTGGAVPPGESDCSCSPQDHILLVESNGVCDDFIFDGLRYGKEYAMEVLDKGEIYVRMVMQRSARNIARAITRFKPVQGFFERAKAISVPKRMALVAAKQSSVDLREFSNLCALGQSQHVDTKLKMPTLADLAVTVFPVRLSTHEVNLAGYKLSKVTGSIYHATPDPESKLKLSVTLNGPIRIAGTTAKSSRQNIFDENGGVTN